MSFGTVLTVRDIRMRASERGSFPSVKEWVEEQFMADGAFEELPYGSDDDGRGGYVWRLRRRDSSGTIRIEVTEQAFMSNELSRRLSEASAHVEALNAGTGRGITIGETGVRQWEP